MSTEQVTEASVSLEGQEKIHLDYDEIEVETGKVDDIEKDHDVFAKKNGGPDFRGLSWLGAAALIAKTQIGLGVLGIPQTFQAMGFVPGLISLVILCTLTTWTGVMVGKFRLRHPSVHSIGDASYILFGRVGLELMGCVSWLFYTLCYGAGLLTVSIAFNTLTGHPVCTMAWVGMGAAVAMVIGLTIRTMKVLSWCGYVAVVSVLAGIWIVAIACLAQSTPAAAPKGEPIDKMIKAVSNSPYSTIATAIGTQVMSLAGTASFFTIHSEMAEQTKFNRALFLGQGVTVLNYIVISCIVYGKVGQYVASPALGSAGPLIKKVAYGISLPALFFACFWQAHIAGKYALVRILRGTKHLQSNSFIHWATWISMMLLVIVVGLVVASSIPFFDDLLGLTGSLLGTGFTLIVPGFMALYMLAEDRGATELSKRPLRWLGQSGKMFFSSKKSFITSVFGWICIIGGAYITVSGVYGSVQSIITEYATGTVGSAFSCADNS